ncbi:MAG: PD40 domain-containing protein [Planctomycetes bacterium]|nr:PD40 domain-containing protein [Planctomycetota bacterium]
MLRDASGRWGVVRSWAAAWAIALFGALAGCKGNINDGDILLALTTRASLGASRTEANNASYEFNFLYWDAPGRQDSFYVFYKNTSISGDGRFVAFASFATNLHPDDTDTLYDVYRKDLLTGAIDLVSRPDGVDPGVKGNGNSYGPSISNDGRYVAFWSESSNLHADDLDGIADVFVRDVETNTTVLVSRASGASGVKGTNISYYPSISGDGQHVVFASLANNLDAADVTNPDPGTDTNYDIYVRQWNPASGLPGDITTTLVSRTNGAGGAKGNGPSFNPSISSDGRHIAFDSQATNLDPDDADFNSDIYVRDMQDNRTVLLSRTSGSSGDKGNSHSFRPSISGNGAFVTFHTRANNLGEDTDPGTSEQEIDVYLVSWGPPAPAPPTPPTLTTTLISRASGVGGVKGNQTSVMPMVSGDGRFVVFLSRASNLVTNDLNSTEDIFVRDTLLNFTLRASVRTFGGESNQFNIGPSISASGSFVAFYSFSSNLVDGDNNNTADVFVRGPLQ